MRFAGAEAVDRPVPGHDGAGPAGIADYFCVRTI